MLAPHDASILAVAAPIPAERLTPLINAVFPPSDIRLA
jgi:hypothetical protein